MEECKLAVTFKIDKNYLHISYKPIKNTEEEITKLALMDNRIVGVDLNPANIGLSTLEFKKDLADYEFVLKDKRFIDIVEINKLTKNKRKRAYIGIVDSIISYLKAFNTKNIALEDLHMPSKDHGKGKALNNCLNKWNRNLIINNLKKKCRIEGINVYITDAKYSTTIGNLMYDYYDPINASIEIGRRGFLYKKIGLKNHFFPEIMLKKTLNLWKDPADNRLNSWIDIHNHVKKILKLRIRVPLDERGLRRIRMKNIPICIF
jgi:IS605 OrfB family transposase